MKKCKICREFFEPTYSSLQPTCTKPQCIISYAKRVEEKKSKREIKAMRERVKSVSHWRRDLQQAFNTYIRERDKHRPCISCDKPLVGKFDAGHFYSVGSYPNLRYTETNCHAQCVECNQHKHGNLIEYSLRLPERIGTLEYHRLHQIKNDALRLSLDEIKEKIQHYRKLLKSLK
jgi:hypothetical protein